MEGEAAFAHGRSTHLKRRAQSCARHDESCVVEAPAVVGQGPPRVKAAAEAADATHAAGGLRCAVGVNEVMPWPRAGGGISCQCVSGPARGRGERVPVWRSAKGLGQTSRGSIGCEGSGVHRRVLQEGRQAQWQQSACIGSMRGEARLWVSKGAGPPWLPWLEPRARRSGSVVVLARRGQARRDCWHALASAGIARRREGGRGGRSRRPQSERVERLLHLCDRQVLRLLQAAQRSLHLLRRADPARGEAARTHDPDSSARRRHRRSRGGSGSRSKGDGGGTRSQEQCAWRFLSRGSVSGAAASRRRRRRRSGRGSAQAGRLEHWTRERRGSGRHCIDPPDTLAAALRPRLARRGGRSQHGERALVAFPEAHEASPAGLRALVELPASDGRA